MVKPVYDTSTYLERYVDALRFEKPKRVPLEPGRPRNPTLDAWYTQGLPADVDYYDYLLESIGIPSEHISKKPREEHLDISFGMIPPFEEKILEHRDGHYVVQERGGAVVEISDVFEPSVVLRAPVDFVTRKWLSFPVKSRNDWEKIKKRYPPDLAERIPHDIQQITERLKDREHPILISLYGPFAQAREWMGMEDLCIAFLDDPELVREMIEFWSDFVSRIVGKLLDFISVDSIQVSEDMAYKAHSMISPAMTREFILPVWKRWVGEFKSKGCAIVGIDSDGYIGQLIPLFIEGGFDYTFPVEVAAGNDIVSFREKYRDCIAFIGGIDKRALAAGGQIMTDEVNRVVPPLMELGGFIPGCDHGVPQDISWPNFVEYTKMLAKLTGWL